MSKSFVNSLPELRPKCSCPRRTPLFQRRERGCAASEKGLGGSGGAIVAGRRRRTWRGLCKTRRIKTERSCKIRFLTFFDFCPQARIHYMGLVPCRGRVPHLCVTTGRELDGQEILGARSPNSQNHSIVSWSSPPPNIKVGESVDAPYLEHGS